MPRRKNSPSKKATPSVQTRKTTQEVDADLFDFEDAASSRSAETNNEDFSESSSSEEEPLQIRNRKKSTVRDDDELPKSKAQYTKKSKRVIQRMNEEENTFPSQPNKIQKNSSHKFTMRLERKLDEHQANVKQILTDPSVTSSWKVRFLSKEFLTLLKTPIFAVLDELLIHDKYPKRETVKEVVEIAHRELLMNQQTSAWEFNIFYAKIQPHCSRHIRECRTRFGKRIRKRFQKLFGKNLTFEKRQEVVKKEIIQKKEVTKWAKLCFVRKRPTDNDKCFVLYALDCYAHGKPLGSNRTDESEEEMEEEEEEEEMDVESATNLLFHSSN